MNFTADKRKFWWGMIGLIVLVLGGLNIHLFWLRKSINNFVLEEAILDNNRMGKIEEFRQKKH
jgi:hypothetical protein